MGSRPARRSDCRRAGPCSRPIRDYAARARFGDRFADIPLTWSEEPELLGTGGALHPLRDFLAPADLVLLINGDSLCRWPLRRLVRRYLAGGARSTLLLTSRPDPARFGGRRPGARSAGSGGPGT